MHTLATVALHTSARHAVGRECSSGSDHHNPRRGSLRYNLGTASLAPHISHQRCDPLCGRKLLLQPCGTRHATRPLSPPLPFPSLPPPAAAGCHADGSCRFCWLRAGQGGGQQTSSRPRRQQTNRASCCIGDCRIVIWPSTIMGHSVAEVEELRCSASAAHKHSSQQRRSHWRLHRGSAQVPRRRRHATANGKGG